MIERSSDAWEHNQFKDVIVRAANVEMQVNFSMSWILVNFSQQLLQSPYVLPPRTTHTFDRPPHCSYSPN